MNLLTIYDDTRQKLLLTLSLVVLSVLYIAHLRDTNNEKSSTTNEFLQNVKEYVSIVYFALLFLLANTNIEDRAETVLRKAWPLICRDRVEKDFSSLRNNIKG